MPMTQKKKPQQGIQQTRTLDLAVCEINKNKRRITVSFSSEYRVTRWYGDEILQHDEGSIDLSRLKNIGVSLFNHDKNYVIGRLENIKLDSVEKRTYCDIIFDNDPESEKIYQKVVNGTLKGVSVGYRADCWEEVYSGKTSSNGRFTGPCEVATKWTPTEVSIVSMPADDSVGIGRDLDNLNNKDLQQNNEREKEMPPAIKEKTPEAKPAESINVEAERQAAKEAERKRTIEINSMCREFDIDSAKAIEFIEKDYSADQAREAIMDHLKTKLKPIAANPEADIRMGEAEEDKVREAASDAILLRAGLKVAKPAYGANEFRSMKLRDLAIEMATRAGITNGHRLDSFELFRRALTPDSQLASVYTSAVNKSMAAAYRASVPTFTAWAGVGSNTDFKTVTHYQISEAGNLDEMTQQSEFKHDEIQDNGVSKRVKTYGKKFGFTRQAIINDDLSVLTKVPQSYVRAALRNRNTQVYKTLADTTLTFAFSSTDTSAIFTSGHANVDLSGAALSVTSLAAAIKAMKIQTNLRGLEKLNINPKFLLVPAALEATAAQLLNSVADPAGNNSGVANIYRNALTPVVDAELDDYDANAWYLAADPAEIDTIEITYLNGNEIPTLESQVGFDFLGMEWRIFDDFGVTALDYRGLYKNTGA